MADHDPAPDDAGARTETDAAAPRPTYADLMAEASELYPGIRIGRPGRARTYWPTIAAMRALRALLDVEVEGAERVAKGPAILVANHVNAWDPAVVVMSTWWRVSAFTKVEWFTSPGRVFFRLMGQIPLRRGDDASTRWALQMAGQSLEHGGMLGLYPEGTRSPDPATLHKLHKRVMIGLLEANPDVAVHAIATRYERRPAPRRIRVRVRISERLPLDPRTQGADEVTGIIREALLELGGQTYVDRYAQEVKAELRAGDPRPQR